MEDSSNVEAAAAAPAAEVHLVEEEEEQQLVPKKNASSIVWQHFGFKREDTAQKDVKSKAIWYCGVEAQAVPSAYELDLPDIPRPDFPTD